MSLRTPHADRPGPRTPSTAQLRAENEKLRARLLESSQTLDAIRGGGVDAFVVHDPAGDRVYVLETADHPYRLMVEHMLQGAATLDAGGRILYVNPAMAALLALPPEQLVDEPFPSLFPPEERPVLEELVQRAATTAATLESRLRVRGVEIPVHVAANPLRIEGTAICAMITDLTVQRRREALEQADRRKDEFLATLAHELRNPLAPIVNAANILNQSGSSEAARELAGKVIDRQARVIARLLDDLQDVSRITLNRLELRKERIALHTPLEMALETSRPLIDASQQELIVDVPHAPVYLHADAVRLAQAFANLLNNAAKYTDRGGRIWLSAKRHGAEVCVAVRDNGIGISKDALPRIFEIFSQAMPAVERSQGGIGIGLSLVRGLVELHGGSVEVRSEGAGRGSEFVVRLPAEDT
jgi:PAS domain S-box-containing protein